MVALSTSISFAHPSLHGGRTRNARRVDILCISLRPTHASSVFVLVIVNTHALGGGQRRARGGGCAERGPRRDAPSRCALGRGGQQLRALQRAFRGGDRVPRAHGFEGR